MGARTVPHHKNKDTHKIILLFDAVSLALVIGASSAALVALVRQIEMSRCTTCSFCGARCERAPQSTVRHLPHHRRLRRRAAADLARSPRTKGDRTPKVSLLLRLLPRLAG